MSKKLITIFLLSIFIICNVGSVFGNDTAITNDNVENRTEIEEQIINEEETVENEKVEEVEEEQEESSNYLKSGEAKEKRDDEYFDVTFLENDGSLIEVKRVKSGEKVSPPKVDIGKNSHAYWIDEEGEAFNFATPIERDIVLKLYILDDQVDPPIYYISFHTNGGSKVNDVSFYEGNPIDNLPTTKKSGYKFLGWFDKSGKEWKIGMTPNGSLDLYAKWGAIESAKTGDENNTLLYVGMMMLASAGLYMSFKRLKGEN